MEKKDLKHLSRSELVDVICEMKKDTTNLNDLTMEEIESEQKRLKDRAVYRKTLKGYIGCSSCHFCFSSYFMDARTIYLWL